MIRKVAGRNVVLATFIPIVFRDDSTITSQCFLRIITRSVMATMELPKSFLSRPLVLRIHELQGHWDGLAPWSLTNSHSKGRSDRRRMRGQAMDFSSVPITIQVMTDCGGRSVQHGWTRTHTACDFVQSKSLSRRSQPVDSMPVLSLLVRFSCFQAAAADRFKNGRLSATMGGCIHRHASHLSGGL
jgi:hypothetical protein